MKYCGKKYEFVEGDNIYRAICCEEEPCDECSQSLNKENNSHNPEVLMCAGVEKENKPVETLRDKELSRGRGHVPTLTSPRDNSSNLNFASKEEKCQ